ncbi:MAG: type II toxin-antitoxin system YafQ family toxin [Coprobacillus sp.]|nr:type II toxin-antitoxin system YafQ family toxin [Coprobacillus sp.]
MYDVVYSHQFKKDVQLLKEQGKNLAKLYDVINILASGETLPSCLDDHKLLGEYRKYRECHIEPDWVLVYEKSDKELYLYLMATGTHAHTLGM